MINPTSTMRGDSPLVSNLNQSSMPSIKAQDAAQSFNALMIEKMLNQATETKAQSNDDFTYSMKQTEYMFNSQLADAISASSMNLTLQVAKEIER